MALVCVYDLSRRNRKKIINSAQVCIIGKDEEGRYWIEFSSDDAVYVNQNDIKNIIKALGYDNNGIEFYLNFIDN